MINASEHGAHATQACRLYSVFVLILLAVGWVVWSHHLQRKIDASEAREVRLQSELELVSRLLEEARRMQPRFVSVLDQPRRVMEEMAEPGWTRALKIIVESAGPGIEWRDVRASRMSKDRAGCILRMSGVATGKGPRVIADRFRMALQAGLEREFHAAVTSRFDGLDDGTDSPVPLNGLQQATFEITATVGDPAALKNGIPHAL